MSYLYCIQCGHMDEVHSGTHRREVIHGDYPYYWLEWQECDGPFAYDEPVMEPFDFDNLIVPDPDELTMMNENALPLLADMEM